MENRKIVLDHFTFLCIFENVLCIWHVDMNICSTTGTIFASRVLFLPIGHVRTEGHLFPRIFFMVVSITIQFIICLHSKLSKKIIAFF
jgi:hypothetical protein